MPDRLKDKVALIVGAGSIGPGWGNGKATAVACAREGAKVFCVDINLSAAEETANIITGEGGLALPFRADVSKNADVEAMVKACIADFGRIDVLDNNVGIAEVGGVVEMSEEAWDKVLDVNLKGAFLTMKHVIPMMVVQGGGSIINISSVAAIRYTGVPYATYYASKAALSHLSRTTAVEYAAQGRAREHDPARPDADADGRAFGRPCEKLRRRQCRGDVEEARRAGADGDRRLGLGHRLGRGVPRERREPLHHRHRSGGRRRADAEGELISPHPDTARPAILVLCMGLFFNFFSAGPGRMRPKSHGHCAPLSIQACASSPSCC